MFLEFYGLTEQPFGVTPNPRFLYLSPAHREALASLLYGIDAGCGFLALVGKPGMGKTTLLFQLLETFRPSARIVFLFHTQCNSREFMRFLLMELGCDIDGERDLVTMYDRFNRCLLQEARAGRRFLIVIDEAQNLEPSVLETVRLLSNFETPQAKLLQIVLAGQPQLANKLTDPALRQLRQRISFVSALLPLPLQEVERYIVHRLWVAGYRNGSLFTAEARKMIAELSDGIPRCVNNLCFGALSLGCALRQRIIDPEIVAEIAADFDVASLISEADTTTRLSSSSKKEASKHGINRAAPARSDDLLSPEEALAYMGEIIQRLRIQ
jgi:general secretion pathway protein A